jgi:hypothetical protein
MADDSDAAHDLAGRKSALAKYVEQVMAHQLEMYSSKRFTDVTVICGRQRFELHASIVTCGSGFFRRILQGSEPCRTVELRAMRAAVFDIIAESLYTGVLSNIDADNVSDLLEASRQLQVPHAEGQCRAWILAHRDQSKAHSPGREAEAPVVEWHIAASTGALSLPQAHLVEIIRDDVWRSVLAHYNGAAANPVLHAEDVVKKYWQE